MSEIRSINAESGKFDYLIGLERLAIAEYAMEHYDSEMATSSNEELLQLAIANALISIACSLAASNFGDTGDSL